ncbi:hypothetical protein [Micromonospora globispora]|nr:hypothetical protein [Micromonospora globispora]
MSTFVTATHDAFVDTLRASGKVDIVADLAPKDQTDVPGSLQEFGRRGHRPRRARLRQGSPPSRPTLNNHISQAISKETK